MNIDLATIKLRKFFGHYKRLPTYEEMCQLFNFSSKNACFYLIGKLVQAGIVEKDDKGRLIPKNLFKIPQLGIIHAGHPSPAETLTDDSIDLYEYILNMPGEIFSLVVKGDSMIEEGITEGDIVIVEKSRKPRDGDVVVACVDNDWTVKYFYRKNDKYVLYPANKKYKPIYPTYDMQIGGVVVSVIRKYH